MYSEGQWPTMMYNEGQWPSNKEWAKICWIKLSL